MTPFYADPWLTVYAGDCREVLRTLPDESVHCVITSPPYWGLRDYGTASWLGGDETCAHRVGGQVQDSKWAGAITTGQRPGAGNVCLACGATRQDNQLGLEPTPEQYVENMVAVFREVRRVLRNDGTLWLNLGSSYLSHDPGGYREGEHLNPDGRPAAKGSGRNRAGTFFAGASGRSRSRQRERAPAYGTDGTGPQGSQGLGSAYSGLCDECRVVLSSSHSPDNGRQPHDDASLPEPTDRDTAPMGSERATVDAVPLASQESTMRRSSPLPPGECSHCDNCGACLAVLRSASRDAQACVRRTVDTSDTTPLLPTSDARIEGTEPSGVAWGDYTSTLKPKDLVPIPWMVAMALQADGWYLRCDVIWSKPNPMPESVTDRPTKSHEYLFLLSKSPRYFFDADAVREQPTPTEDRRALYHKRTTQHDSTHAGWENGRIVRDTKGNGITTYSVNPAGRNIRSVWTIPTQPYPGAHFAVFPPKLVEPCVKAGTSERGVCPECGAPWRRVQEKGELVSSYSGTSNPNWHEPDARYVRVADEGESKIDGDFRTRQSVAGWKHLPRRERTTTGWEPSCVCVTGRLPVPATILDPFAGSGTVGVVAQRLSRRAILIDLNPAYLEQQLARNAYIPLGLAI